MSARPGRRERLLRRARGTEGYFREDEAELLMRCVGDLRPGESVLEVGSYHGRSTLFGLAALGPGRHWYAVDDFRTAAGYAHHSYLQLLTHVADPRLRLLPLTLAAAWQHLAPVPLGLSFLDGDHSLLGVGQDAAIAIALLDGAGTLLCHDVTDLFPGVPLLTDCLVGAGVLIERERVCTLVAYDVVESPSWLTDPSVYRG